MLIMFADRCQRKSNLANYNHENVWFDWLSHNTQELEMWHLSECSDFAMKKTLEDKKDRIGFD